MSLANNPPVNSRSIRDINYIANVAGPIAANTANTAALDLIQAVPYPVTQYVQAQILITASATGANNKNVNCVLQQTAVNATTPNTPDNGNWINIPTLATPLLTVIDNNGGGWAAGTVTVLLPPNVARFIRAQAVGEVNGSNASAATVTLQLLF